MATRDPDHPYLGSGHPDRAFVLILLSVPGSRRFAVRRFWCVLAHHRIQRLCYEARLHAIGHGCARRVQEPGDTGGWAMTVTVRALETAVCGHGRPSAAYAPPPSLWHLIQIRNTTCVFPGCKRPARQCDQDHTVPFDRGGRTCECNLVPACLS